MMAVDILPTALPLEASQHFSQAFLPYLRSVISRYTGKQQDDKIKEALDRATVASGGELRSSFEWLRNPLGVWKDSLRNPSSSATTSSSVCSDAQAGPTKRKSQIGVQPKRNVLMLGSGMVAPPAVAEICSRPDVQLVVGTWIQSGLQCSYPIQSTHATLYCCSEQCADGC